MAVRWPAWPFVLCLVCALSAMGIGLGVGAFWALAGGAILGGVDDCRFWGWSRRGSSCLGLACSGVLGLDSGCCLAAVFSGALDGAGGVVAGLVLGMAVVCVIGGGASGWGLGCIWV